MSCEPGQRSSKLQDATRDTSSIRARTAILAATAVFGVLTLGPGTLAHAADALSQKTQTVSLQSARPVTTTLSRSESLPLADRLVVRKAERRLYLMRGESVLRSYRIALGLNPTGQKERSGDYRTPEGRYYLSRRNPRSDYFLSIQVSYPNDDDLRRARRHRWDAGGAIMIHGLPNQLSRSPEYYERTDWTDGCIAVSNSDMLEIWLLTPDHVPIDILP